MTQSLKQPQDNGSGLEMEPGSWSHGGLCQAEPLDLYGQHQGRRTETGRLISLGEVYWELHRPVVGAGERGGGAGTLQRLEGWRLGPGSPPGAAAASARPQTASCLVRNNFSSCRGRGACGGRPPASTSRNLGRESWVSPGGSCRKRSPGRSTLVSQGGMVQGCLSIMSL